MAALAKRNADRAGVSGRVDMIQGDIFKEDFSKATVVTMYLLPDLNLRLKPIRKKMLPGTRIVSHSFDMQSWEPDLRIETGAASGFMWIVPAPAAGRWTIDIPGFKEPAVLTLTQIHQMLTGSLKLDGKTVPIEGARMRGADMRFQVQWGGGEVLMFEGRILGERPGSRPGGRPNPRSLYHPPIGRA